MTTHGTFWTILALTLALACPAPGLAADGEAAAARDLALRYVEECLNGGDPACFEEFVFPEKAAKARKFHDFRRSFFPDLRYEVLEVLADGDRVMVLVTTRGRHTGHGDLDEGKEPVPPSHRALEVDEVFLFRVAGGRLGDGKMVSDNLAVAKAVGYVVQPPGAQ